MPDGGQTLSRRLGFTLLTLYGLGVTVGAGIYVLIGQVAGLAGAFAPLAFVVAAIVVAPTAFSFSRLASMYPFASGEARYVSEAFGSPILTTIVGLFVGAVGVVSAATVAVGSVGYIRELVELPRLLIISVVIVGFGAIVLRGIRESVLFAAVMTLVEVGGLLIIIALGLVAVPERVVAAAGHAFDVANTGQVSGLIAASILAFYAFIGFEDMVNVAEEVKTPERVFPISILTVLIVTAGLYFAIAIVALALVAPADLAVSEAPLSLVGAEAGFSNGAIISAIGAIAALNGVLIQMIMSSRVLYGLANMGRLPKLLGVVSARSQTPVNAIMFVVACILALALLFPIATLAETTSTITLAVFVLVNGALLKMIRDEKMRGGFVNLFFPAIGVILSGVLLAAGLLL